MKVTVAYIDEPPFYWRGPDGSVTGADIELADVVLRAAGASAIEFHHTSFEELLPGVQENRWHMNVPIFVTSERARHVLFSSPVWALGDGFLVHDTNPKSLAGYSDVAASSNARLGVVGGTIQIDAAKSAGVDEKRIVRFRNQADAVGALIKGDIDAYAATSVGNRSLAAGNKGLEVIALELGAMGKAPVGAFSFNKDNHNLVRAVNEQLRKYLGTEDHLGRMAKYGITRTEIDPVVEH